MKKWGIIDILLVLAFIFGLTNLFTWLTSGLFSSLVITQKYFISTIFQTGAVIIALMYFIIIKGVSFRQLGIHFSNLIRVIKSGLIGGVFLFFIIVVAGLVMQLLYPQEPTLQPFAELVMNAEGNDLILLFIMGSILAPLGEEIYFRGMAYPVFKEKWGVAVGLIVSGMFFSLLHFDILRFFPLMLGGIGLAYIYEKTGSLFSSMIAHGLWNGIMILLLYNTSVVL